MSNGETRFNFFSATIVAFLTIVTCGPALASDQKTSNENKNWDTVFGIQESWVGTAGSALSIERYFQLIDSQTSTNSLIAREWSIIIKLIGNQRPMNQLHLVNKFFNQKPYQTDYTLHQQPDYWASASEFMKNGGDCEDYAIAKYRALVEGGFPAESLRIILLEDRITHEPHAILAARVDDKTYILDNQRSEVTLESNIGNYRPLYSLNEVGVWRYSAPNTTPQDLSHITFATRSE